MFQLKTKTAQTDVKGRAAVGPSCSVITEEDFTEVSRVRASSFPVKAEISSSYLIYIDQ